jgi:DNA-binding CsgD family transcriptional regulator
MTTERRSARGRRQCPDRQRPGPQRPDRPGIVLFGDVADSRADSARAAAWLRTLSRELDRHYGDGRLAPFGFTQGDEIQGLLATDADPTAAIIRAALHADAMPMRWVVVVGRVEPGSGPATQRTGPAFVAARELVAVARKRRLGLVVRSGHPPTDELLDDVAPALAAMLDALTPRQRAVARLVLVDGLRQADAAQRLHVSRPTVSVAVERSRAREIAGLADAVRKLLRQGIDGAVASSADGAGNGRTAA